VFWRALLAFLACPGIVAYLVPLSMRSLQDAHKQIEPLGWPSVILGSALLLWCVRDFYVKGSGTLAPWAPPTKLVIVGLYRFSRNPMYVSVTLILIGWAVLFQSRSLWIYAGIVWIAFHLRVVLGEEPWLAKVHGDEWRAYAARVPRWLFATSLFFRNQDPANDVNQDAGEGRRQDRDQNE
jgi:protein-S-isoprenylcysteine O-methyltransferase Ste14